jgi:hypothetical protein
MPATEPAWSGVRWYQLHWPRPLDPDRALGLLRSWAADSRSPQLVLEVRSTPDAVRYLLGVNSASSASILAGLTVHVPGMLVVSIKDRPTTIERTVSLRASTRHRPLRYDEAAVSVRSILSAVTNVRKGEEVVLQLVLGPRRTPQAIPTNTPSSTVDSVWRVAWHGNGQQLDGEKRTALRSKVSDHGFACTIRLGVQADPDRQRSLIAGLFSALRTAEAAGLKLRLRSDSAARLNTARSPWLVWPLRLNCNELLALTGWPLGDEDLPGQPPLHPKALPPIAGTDGRGRVFATSTLPGLERPLGLRATDALQHVWVIGPTGSGKSTLLGRLIDADVRDGRAVVLIEPKGDLVQDVLEHLPANRAKDVVILDPTDSAPIGLNPLSSAGRRPELVADGLLSVFRQLYGEAIGPRSADILYAGLLTLAQRSEASLVMLPLLLTNDGFRRSLTATIRDPITLEPFWTQFNAWSEAERAAAIAPVMNKLRPLLRPSVRGVLGQREPRFQLRQVFTEHKIFLVPLRRGLIGPEASSLIGSLALAELWQTTQERAGVAANRRHPVMVYVDEVQDYLHLGTDLGEALAQARGYGVAFHLAHQFVAQLPTEMKAAIASNARTRIGFQLGHADAVELTKGHNELTADDFMALDQFQIYASIFAGGKVTPYASGRTLAPAMAISNADQLRRLSRDQYGRPLDEIEAGFAELLDTGAPDLGQPGRRRRQS